MIAENLYSQVDHEGNQFILLDEIVDHVHDETAKPGHNKMNGWKLCVLWKDGSTSWEQLKDLKHGFPVRAAEYALSRELQDLPAFSWWVKQTIKKKDRIIKAVRTRYLKKTHKFGLRLPKTVQLEHTHILRALVEHPQGNLEEIQQKTLQSTQEEPGGRQDRKA
jgi:hypothetical protein